MAAEEDERVTVRTYVPASQRAVWTEHAEELEMSLSEFVGSMVQAGRRDFEPSSEPATPVEPAVPDSDPRGNGLEDRVLDVLREEGHCTWQELLDAVTADVEDRLEAALEELQAANRVVHSPRAGGYTVVDDE